MMKLLSGLAAILVALILFAPAARAQTQTQHTFPHDFQARHDYCDYAGNALFRQKAVQTDERTMKVKCMCSPEPRSMEGFMTWCQTMASDQDLQKLTKSVDDSPCIKPENLQNCIQN